MYYYTAGIKSYGLQILDILQMEIKRQYSAELLQGMSHMFSHKKLIGRDEKGRFMSNKDMSDLERIKEEMIEEMKLK